MSSLINWELSENLYKCHLERIAKTKARENKEEIERDSDGNIEIYDNKDGLVIIFSNIVEGSQAMLVYGPKEFYDMIDDEEVKEQVRSSYVGDHFHYNELYP